LVKIFFQIKNRKKNSKKLSKHGSSRNLFPLISSYLSDDQLKSNTNDNLKNANNINMGLNNSNPATTNRPLDLIESNHNSLNLIPREATTGLPLKIDK
jgi:hypothetical protein